jgi:hypothetical protein
MLVPQHYVQEEVVAVARFLAEEVVAAPTAVGA